LNTLYRLQTIFREVFADPALVITNETAVANFPDWDSVATVQLVLAIEAEYGIRFTTDEVAGVRSVRDILAVLKATHNDN
jgi:acyl carrier protein